MSEKNLDIVTLSVWAYIQGSMHQFLKPGILPSQKKWLCPSCNRSELCPASILIQLWQFSYQGGQLMKNGNFFTCTQSESNKDLTVPIIIEDEVSFTNKYSLIATINHSSTLNRGHY